MGEYIDKRHEIFLKKNKRHKILILTAQAGVLAVFAALWEISAALGWIDPFLMSSPSRIWNTLAELRRRGVVLPHLDFALRNHSRLCDRHGGGNRRRRNHVVVKKRPRSSAALRRGAEQPA